MTGLVSLTVKVKCRVGDSDTSDTESCAAFPIAFPQISIETEAWLSSVYWRSAQWIKFHSCLSRTSQNNKLRFTENGVYFE